MSKEEGDAVLKKRSREEEMGFGTPAAKTAAKLGADICMLMGQTVQYVHDTLAPCKTIKEFKKAREDIEENAVQAQGKLVALVLKMAKENSQ